MWSLGWMLKELKKDYLSVEVHFLEAFCCRKGSWKNDERYSMMLFEISRM